MSAKKRDLKTAFAEGMVAGNPITEEDRFNRMNELTDMLANKADLENGADKFKELNALVHLGFARNELKEARELLVLLGKYEKVLKENGWSDEEIEALSPSYYQAKHKIIRLNKSKNKTP